MVLGIFGKKSDHPLADIKNVQQMLQVIPNTDSLKALQDLTEWIEDLTGLAEELRLEHQWAVLRLLDQAAQPHVRKLLNDYFTVVPPAKFQENRLWTLLDGFYTQSESCHFDVLTRFRDGARSASAVRSELTLLCARGIHACGGRLKMAAARYGMVDPSIWKHIAGYYAITETQAIQQEPLVIYQGENSSVAQEFATLLAWYGVGSGKQISLQIHITERLFSNLGKALKVGNTYNGQGLFVFDIAQPTPPMRATAEATIHPTLRFIEAEGMRQLMDGVLKTLDKGIVPDSLNLYGARYDAEVVAAVARGLTQCLSLPPPTRRSVRRKVNVNLKVASGFFKMLEQTDSGLSFSADDTDTWDVQDISSTGFRCVVPLAQVEGVKIGSLVGNKPENLPQWGAGVVRRLSRDAAGNMHVGVEMLSTQVVGVPLVDRTKTGAQAGMLGLYLNRASDTSGEAWLLLKQETFSHNRSLTMYLNDKGFLLLPVALVERGEDYDLARYRMMEQEDSTEE